MKNTAISGFDNQDALSKLISDKHRLNSIARRIVNKNILTKQEVKLFEIAQDRVEDTGLKARYIRLYKQYKEYTNSDKGVVSTNDLDEISSDSEADEGSLHINVKNKEVLCTEFKELNKNLSTKSIHAVDGISEASLNKVSECFEKDSDIFPHMLPIKKWKEQHIKIWSNAVKIEYRVSEQNTIKGKVLSKSKPKVWYLIVRIYTKL